MVAALLTFPQAAWAACELQKIAEYPLVLDGGRPLVPGTINGAPVKFLLDTGAESTMLTRSAVKRLGLKAARIDRLKFYGVGGADYADETTIREIKFGDATVHDVTMIVAGQEREGDVDGFLGENFLNHSDLEMDWAHGAIRFIQPKDCRGDQVVYWGQGYSVADLQPVDRPVIKVFVELNGHRLLAQIDSGADRSVVTPFGARRAGLSAVDAASDGLSHGIGRDAVRTRVALFQTFRIGDETIRNVTLQIADLFGGDTEVDTGSHISSPVYNNPDMLLGADFLRAHRVYLAYSQGKVYFSYLGGPIFRSPNATKP